MSRHWPAMPRRSSASLSDVVSSFAARSTTGSGVDVIVASAAGGTRPTDRKAGSSFSPGVLRLLQHRLVGSVHDLTDAHAIVERHHHRPLTLCDRFRGGEHAGDIGLLDEHDAAAVGYHVVAGRDLDVA